MSAIFDHAVKEILRHEGGYVDDPVDRGGETKYGISKRSYPDLDIANLTLEQAPYTIRDTHVYHEVENPCGYDLIH